MMPRPAMPRYSPIACRTEAVADGPELTKRPSGANKCTNSGGSATDLRRDPRPIVLAAFGLVFAQTCRGGHPKSPPITLPGLELEKSIHCAERVCP